MIKTSEVLSLFFRAHDKRIITVDMMARLTRCSLWCFLPSSLLWLSLGTSPDGLRRLLSVPTAWPPVCTHFNHVATNKQKQLWHINPSDEYVNTIFLFLLLHQPGFGSVGKISKLHITREKRKMTFQSRSRAFQLAFRDKICFISCLDLSRHRTTTTGLFVPKNKSRPTQRI